MEDEGIEHPALTPLANSFSCSPNRAPVNPRPFPATPANINHCAAILSQHCDAFFPRNPGVADSSVDWPVGCFLTVSPCGPDCVAYRHTTPLHPGHNPSLSSTQILNRESILARTRAE